MIVWLASYPRSGNTYARILLQRHFGLSTISIHDDTNDIAANASLAKLTGHETVDKDWSEAYHDFLYSDELHIVKTHSAPIDDNKAIYILRDPRAVVVSYKRYLENFIHRDVEFSEIITGSVGFGSWSEHYLQWDPLNRPNTLFLKYEDICSNPEAAIDKISAFIEKPITNSEDITFEELQQVDSKFFRSGSNKRNIKELDSVSLELLETLYTSLMDTHGYEKLTPAENISSNLQDAISKLSLRAAHQRHLFENSQLKLEMAKRHTSSLRTRLSQNDELLETASSSYDELQESIAPLQERNSDLVNQMRKLEVDNKSLKYSLDLISDRSKLQDEFRSRMFESTSTRLKEVQKEALEQKEILLIKDHHTTNELHLAQKENERLHGKLLTIEAKNDELENHLAKTQDEHTSAVKRTNEMKTLLSRSLEREDKAKKANVSLSQELKNCQAQLVASESAQDQYKVKLSELQTAVNPRLKSILTLRPLRHAYRQRQHIKSGALTIDENGLPWWKGEERPQPLLFENIDEVVDTPVTIPVEVKERASIYKSYTPKTDLGIAVFAFDRTENLRNTLESLSRQDALEHVHVFIDGDQGRPNKRDLLDKTEILAREYGVKHIHRQRGNFGFRKMMILSIRKMFQLYEHALFLEDDCFPNRYAVRGFSYELDEISSRDDIFSVYGHHFGVKGESDAFPRFQGWGWATTRQKAMSVWPDLLECYLMDETDYLDFIKVNSSEDVVRRLSVTPGRDPFSTITKFFAWDETLAFLTAMKGLSHRPSKEALVKNYGLGKGSTHFGVNPIFLKPPFNMVLPEDIWSHY